METGNTYTFKELQQTFGNALSFIFSRNKIATAIIISPDMNPDFSQIDQSWKSPIWGAILVARGKNRVRDSRCLQQSTEPLPAFVKMGINKWHYVGNYKFVRVSDNFNELNQRTNSAKIMKSEILHVIYLKLDKTQSNIAQQRRLVAA